MKRLVTAVLLLVSGSLAAADAFHVENLVLLQPDQMLKDRVECVQEYAEYFKAVNAAAESAASGFKSRAPSAGFIVFAVRANGERKAWTDFNPRLAPSDEAALVAAVEAVPPFRVRQGTVLGASKLTLWGAPAATETLPSPDEWREAFSKLDKATEVTEMVDGLWRPPSRSVQSEPLAPVTRGN